MDDAILFSSDLAFEPPNADPEMAVFRRRCLRHPGQPETAGDYDLVVTGGGITGTCAAVTAARLGLKVALIQDRPVLGGNNSSEVRVWLQGARSKEPWPRVGDVVAELESERRAHYGPSNTADLYEDDKKLAVVRGEPNIDLFLEHRSNGIEMDGRRIRAVLAQEIRTGRRVRFTGRWFADCTGDACIGALAGADFDMRLENKMGPCNLWNVCECKDTNARNIENLFMAGRGISVTHEALGAVRVMRTCGTGGEIVGMAASVCKDFGIDPRAVYEKHLASLQERMRKGDGKIDGSTIPYSNQGERKSGMGKNALPQPEWLERAGENLARKAKVSATPRPTDDGIDRSVLLTDGNGKIEDNSARWLGKGPLPHVIEFRWDLPVVIGAARVISGWNDGNRVIAPVSSFKRVQDKKVGLDTRGLS